jgi:hypothetical protein
MNINFAIDASYIRGFGDADGSCTNRGTVQLYNTNLDLLKGIMFALQKLTIKSGIYSANKIIMSEVTGIPHKQPHVLAVSGVDNLAKYANLVGFNVDYKMNNLTTYLKSQCQTGRPGNLSTYFKYLELKNSGMGVTKMSRILDLTLSNLQYRIKYKYPLDETLIKILMPYQP